MKPLRLYIDNCSLNDVAPKEIEWKETELGKFLMDKSLKEEVEVWASPAGVLEIALNKDLNQRNNMARALNTLIKGQRMMPSKEFLIIDELLRVVNATWSGSITFDRMEFLKSTSARIYIALLGQLAALKDYDCSAGFKGIVEPKLATQIIHSEIMANPKIEIQKRIDAIRAKIYSKISYYNSLHNDTIEELYEKQKEYEAQKFSIDKIAVKLLQTNLQLLIEGYSLDDLSFSASQVFVYIEDIVSTFDFSEIVKNWNSLSPIENKKGIAVKPLEEILIQSFSTGSQTINQTKLVLKLLVDRFYNQLQFSQISNHIIFKDLEKGLKVGKIPSGGIVLDSSHCIAALYNEILLSRDNRLNASVDYWFKEITKDTGLYRETVKNLSELKRKVENGLKRL